MLGMFNKKPEPTDEEVTRKRAQLKQTLGVVAGAGIAVATALSPDSAEAQSIPATREAQKTDLINIVMELNNDIQQLIPNMRNKDIASSVTKRLTELLTDVQRISKLNEWVTPTGADGLVRYELFSLRRNIEKFKEELRAVALVEDGYSKIYKKVIEAYARIEKYSF